MLTRFFLLILVENQHPQVDESLTLQVLLSIGNPLVQRQRVLNSRKKTLWYEPSYIYQNLMQ